MPLSAFSENLDRLWIRDSHTFFQRPYQRQYAQRHELLEDAFNYFEGSDTRRFNLLPRSRSALFHPADPHLSTLTVHE